MDAVQAPIFAMPPDKQSEWDWIYRLTVTEADGMYVFSSPQTKTELHLPKEDLPLLSSVVESKLKFSIDYPENESAVIVACRSTGTSIKVPFADLASFSTAVADLRVTYEVIEDEQASE